MAIRQLFNTNYSINMFIFSFNIKLLASSFSWPLYSSCYHSPQPHCHPWPLLRPQLPASSPNLFLHPASFLQWAVPGGFWWRICRQSGSGAGRLLPLHSHCQTWLSYFDALYYYWILSRFGPAKRSWVDGQRGDEHFLWKMNDTSYLEAHDYHLSFYLFYGPFTHSWSTYPARTTA